MNLFVSNFNGDASDELNISSHRFVKVFKSRIPTAELNRSPQALTYNRIWFSRNSFTKVDY